MTGLVLKSTGSWYEIIHDAQIYQARTRGKLRLKGTKTTNPVAVGDYVKLEKDGGNMIITEVLPRENYIIRKSVHKRDESHILAANIDQALIIVTLKFPRTSIGFIDRFLVTAESFRIPQVIVFNKQDLLSGKLLAVQQDLITIYEGLGITCILSSAKTARGLDAFKNILQNKKTLVAGHSGVGKSTLINTLSPDINLKTGQVSKMVEKGTHTTTFAEMIMLDPQTFIIDTPGIKELGLADIPPEELSDYFPEMRKISRQCKFNNCLHIHEPKCAVKEAIESGDISISRYESYLSMLEDHDNRR